MDNNLICDKLYSLVLKKRFSSGILFFDELAKNHIPYAIHKGAVLSQVLYGSPSYRKSGDVDLLFSRDDIDKVKEIFEYAGFIQGRIVNQIIIPHTRFEKIYHVSQSHQLAPFVKDTHDRLCPFVEYDCNVDIFWGESEQHADMKHFLENTTEIELFNIPLKKLTHEAEFIALCMHHYKDCNSLYLLWKNGFSKEKLFDIAKYTEVAPLDIQKLLTLCCSFHVENYVCYCVHFANILHPNSTLQKIESELSNADICLLYECFGLCEKERKTWNVPFAERICNVQQYMEPLLTEDDRIKIMKNEKLM